MYERRRIFSIKSWPLGCLLGLIVGSKQRAKELQGMGVALLNFP